MKKRLMMLIAILLIAVLGACGKTDNQDDLANQLNDDVTNDQQVADNELNDDQNNAAQETNDKSGINEKMAEFSFTEIELQVEYGEDKEYEAEVEKKSSGEYKAEVEDDLKDVYLRGEEAFDHLHPILQGLDINSSSTKQEVIDAVLQSFELADDYQNFEIEITFNDGTKIEYDDKK